MAVKRGQTAWTTTKSWPAGTQVGDLALLATWGTSTTNRVRNNPEWRAAGRFVYYSGGDARWTKWEGHLWVATVTTEMLGKAPPSNYGQLVTFGGTPGIGTVRVNSGAVPARAGGGVVSFSYTADSAASDLDSDTTWLTPAGMFHQPSIYGTVGARAVVGWTPAASDGTYGDGSIRGSLAVEILPPVAPTAPRTLSPSDGEEISSLEPVGFQWQHQPSVPGGFQDAYRLRVDGGAGWTYWNASTQTFVSSEFTNVSAVQFQDIDSTKFVSQVPYDWEVATREGLDGQWSDYSPAGSFMTVTPPTATLTGPSATVTNDLTPTVTWTNNTPRGEQTAFRVQVVHTTSATVVYDSYAQPGDDTSWTLPALDWTREAQYEVRLMVQQTGGSWSVWDTLTFTITWTLPAAPSITVQDGDQGVLVEISSALPVMMQRISPEGIWEDLLPVTPTTGGELKFPDVLAPFEVATAYRVRSVNSLDGQELTSDWVVSSPVVSTDLQAYIASAYNPLQTWLPVDIHNDDNSVGWREPVSVTYGMHDPYGRTMYGVDQHRYSSITLHTTNENESSALLALLQSQEPLLVRFVPRKSADECSWGKGELLTISRSTEIEEVSLHLLYQDKLYKFGWIEHPPVAPGNLSTAPITQVF